MTDIFREISEDAFDELYPLVPNHLNPSAGWVKGAGRGCLFETYGDELEFVRRQSPCTIWTLLDGDDDDDDLYLVNGYHFVNRIGYLISTVPIPEGVTIEVRIPTQTEGDADDASGDPEPIRKQLTSSGMVHTPGLFRALRNDYRIKGAPRRRAIKILSDVYGLPPGEAKGLLGGAIRIEIDEAAGTITYTTAIAEVTTGERPSARHVHDL